MYGILLLILGWILFLGNEFLLSIEDITHEVLEFKPQNAKLILNSGISENYNIKWILIIIISICILILIDSVPRYWYERIKKKNNVNSKNYDNLLSLLLNESYLYINNIPNLLTLIVGSIQAYSTTKYSKINILNILEIPIFYGNYINLLVTVICLNFGIIISYISYKESVINDEKINGMCVKRVIDGKIEIIRSDKIVKGNKIKLEYGDISCGYLKVLDMKCVKNIENIIKMDIMSCGYYYDKEGQGEEVSKKFKKGDIIPPLRKMTRPDLIIECILVDYIDNIDSIIYKERNPKVLDNVRIGMDIIAIILLIIFSYSITASALKNKEIDILLVLKHLLAGCISVNSIIPSMRMTLLYNVYQLVLMVMYNNISIQSFKELEKIRGMCQITFDKTGTITQEGLWIYKVEHIENEMELCSILSLGNSESNVNIEGECWGTSPEECCILKYWLGNNLKLIHNPLGNVGKLVYEWCGEKKSIIIKERNKFEYKKGKLCKLIYKEDEYEIRQHGSSYFKELGVKEDERRSLSICYRKNEGEWQMCSTYIFENPLRQNIPEVMYNFEKWGIKPNILTGDSILAAITIGKKSGINMDNVLVIDKKSKSNEIIKKIEKDNNSIIIEGDIIEDWFVKDLEGLKELLNNKKINKIIARASREVKRKVHVLMNKSIHVGDAKNDELALKSSEIGICLRHGSIDCRRISGIIINEPKDLIDILEKNGYYDMLYYGGDRLFIDLCWFSGIIVGGLTIGIHNNGFELIPNTFLYKDVWSPIKMLIVSSLHYSVSCIAYSSSNNSVGEYYRRKPIKNILESSKWLISGIIIGVIIGWTMKYLEMFDIRVLYLLDGIVLMKHNWNARLKLFGSQPTKNSVGFILSVLDSIPVRIIMYCLIFLF